jgi:sporulation protein YlmC with PRC-barrel domain
MRPAWALTLALALATAPSAAGSASASGEAQPSQAQAEKPAPAPDAAKPPAAAVVDGQEVEGILGKEVQSKKGEKMGEVIDVIVDPQGRVRAALIDFGGFLGVGSRKLAIDWRAVHFIPTGKSFRVVVDLTKDQLKGAPEYKQGKQTVILETPAPEPPAPGKPPTR